MSLVAHTSGRPAKRKRSKRAAQSSKSSIDISANDRDASNIPTNPSKDQLEEISNMLQRIDERGEKIEVAIFDLRNESDQLRKQLQSLLREKEERKEEMELMKKKLRLTTTPILITE